VLRLEDAPDARARLQSRQLRSLTLYFPDVVDALATSFRDVVLDGELVVYRDGRPDFTALQRRLVSPHAGADTPASFLVLDVLEMPGLPRGRARRSSLWSPHRLLRLRGMKAPVVRAARV
jgi:ATP-dependent DNA ligase